MKRFTLSSLLIVILSTFFIAKAQNGFVVWTSNTHSLLFKQLANGQPGELKNAVEKGGGADIEVVISYDGVWLAFARSEKVLKDRYGECDYHAFDSYDIYIAKIDNGYNLPAKPIKIDHGYWPSWGEDANNPDKPKTLYYSKYSDNTIQKVIIQPDGTFSKPMVHAQCPKKIKGLNAHMQGSPDGKYIAYRDKGLKVVEVTTGTHVPGAGGSGVHPCWGPRSNYLIWAQNRVCRIDSDSGVSLGSAGLSRQYYGISNDTYYDKGKLWIIGQRYISGSNPSEPVEFKSVDISGGGWNVGESTKVGSGTWCDIHVYAESIAPSAPTGLKTESVNKTSCKLSWTPPAFGSGLKYYIYRDGAQIGSVDKNEFIDTTIILDKQYYYHVTAFNALGESIASNALQVNVFAPSTPSGLVINSAEETRCFFSWNKADIDGVYYTIYRNGVKLDTNNYYFYHDTTLSANKQYTYEVSAFNMFGESAKSNPLLVSTESQKPLPSSTNGFVVWSEGSNCKRELKFKRIEKENGAVGEMKTAVNKGKGTDIGVVISYDGVWIAFARTDSIANSTCEELTFEPFDIFIAKIDNGKNLPAKPIKVGQGSWPSWGSDADNPEKPKTLYFFGGYSNQTIQKVIIQPDGSFSQPVLYAKSPVKDGTKAQLQMASNGRYVLYRGDEMRVYDLLNGDYMIRANAEGEYPCWGPRGNYVLLSDFRAAVIRDRNPSTIVYQSLSSYYCGLSNDAEYDQKRLWLVRRTGNAKHGVGDFIEITAVDISNDGWRTGPLGTQISHNGTWCDIHVTNTTVNSTYKDHRFDNRSVVDAAVLKRARGIHLVVESFELIEFSAGLFNVQGKRVAFVKTSGKTKKVIPLPGIVNGMYVLQLDAAGVKTQKPIWIIE